MCKVFMMAGIKKEKAKASWQFAQAMAKLMSKHNDDGLGYAAITAEGKIFGERWLDNSSAFKHVGDINQKIVDIFGNAISSNVDNKILYNSFGDIDYDNAAAITMHARYATSPKGLNNVHPFYDEGVSIIHNGVIRNDKAFDIKLSTCDSEAILRSYIKHDVSTDPENIKRMAKSLEGYYSVGVLTNTSIGPTLDIIRYNATQHVVWIHELDTWVLSTSDTDIKDVCKEFGYTMGSVFSILNEKFIRVNAVTGLHESIVDFDGTPDRGYGTANGGHGSYYAGGHNTNPTQGRTQTGSGTPSGTSSTTHNALSSAKKTVVPFNNKRTNSSLQEYFLAGKVTCIALTEREVQAEILLQEKLYGRV